MPKTIRPLTMKEIEALTSTKAIGGAPGLFCDVQKTATGYSRSYFLRYRGKRYTIGSIKRVTLKEARTTASAYREEIDRGGNPTERKRAARAPQSKPLTLAELFDWHMVHRLEKDKIKEKDEKTTRSRFARFIPEELKEKAAAEITPQDITNGIEKAWLNTHESARRLPCKTLPSCAKCYSTPCPRLLGMLTTTITQHLGPRRSPSLLPP